MSEHNINEDHGRFREILRGMIRKRLGKYLARPDQIIRDGGKNIAIPMPRIDTPRFKFTDKQNGGVGQGDGDVGDPLGRDEGDESGQAGDQPGDHAQEIEYSSEEFMDIVGEELELLNLREKGKGKVVRAKDRYTGIRRTGPPGLRHQRRSLRQALKREIASGSYDIRKPRIILVKEDLRFRAPQPIFEEQFQAVVIYIMDVSGSMGDEQKMMARTLSFWIDMWIEKNFDGFERRFIIHDAEAKEVDRETFFRTKESGGTKISSAYSLCTRMIRKDYPVNDWNIYVFHFSDGDNLNREDDNLCANILAREIVPSVNMFFYGQVKSPQGSGQFKDILNGHQLLKELNGGKIRTTQINSRDDTMRAMKELLGKNQKKE